MFRIFSVLRTPSQALITFTGIIPSGRSYGGQMRWKKFEAARIGLPVIGSMW